MHRCGIDVWKMMFHLLCQMLGIANPVTGLARTGRFVVAQMLVQSLDKLDAFTQGNAQHFRRHVIEFAEVLHAGLPPTTFTRAVIAPFAGGFKHVFVVVVVVFDELLEQQARVHKRFYEFWSHRILLSTIAPDYAYRTVYSTAINGMLDA
jgi:hypothetical protein